MQNGKISENLKNYKKSQEINFLLKKYENFENVFFCRKKMLFP